MVHAIARGLDKLERCGVPGEVRVFGWNAEVVVVANNPTTPVVAAWSGEKDHFKPEEADAKENAAGHIVAISHEGYLKHTAKGTEELPQTALLLRNSLRWLCGSQQLDKQQRPVVGILGKKVRFLDQLLSRIGLDKEMTAVEFDLSSPHPQPQVIIWLGKQGSGDVCPLEQAYEYQPIIDFVRSGGGLLVAMCPWGFEQVTQVDLRTSCAQNHVLRNFGLVFGSSPTHAAEGLALYVPPRDGDDTGCEKDPHDGHLLHYLEQGRITSKEAIQHAARSICATYAALPSSSMTVTQGDDASEIFQVACEQLARDAQLDEHLEAEALEAISFEAPHHHQFRVNFQGGDARAQVGRRITASLMTKQDSSRAGGLDACTPLPGAIVFPCMGRCTADIELVKEPCRVRVSSSLKEWMSTGLFLPPGIETIVSVSDGSPANWVVRVGCHTDKLWHLSKWWRWPEISRTFPLKEQHRTQTGQGTVISHPWGGIIYLEHTSNSSEEIEVTFMFVARHARYRVMSHDFEQWEQELPLSPWCELEGQHCILTVPSLALLSRPDLNTRENLDVALHFWDTVLETHYQLVNRSPPRRKERVVADVQISAGYMHAGYPIMIQLDQVFASSDKAPVIIDGRQLWQKGSWGMLHEFGHHIQDPAWTFEGTGEVTVNFFTLYSMDKVVQITPWEHPWLQPHKIKAKAYLHEDKRPARVKFGTWKSDPGLALVTYARLQHIFGWEVFTKCFDLYRREQPDVPNEHDKIWTFVHMMSRAVGFDLTPYFHAWCWPVQPLSSSASSSALPDHVLHNLLHF
eukprot:m.229673 g.229673  ORF g.229673 m.229673 type:complete len:799 (+) comp17056_c0_seq1:2015-4411(+)